MEAAAANCGRTNHPRLPHLEAAQAAAPVAVAQQAQVQLRHSRSICRVLQIMMAMDCQMICQAITMQLKDQRPVLLLTMTTTATALPTASKRILEPTLTQPIRAPTRSILTPMVTVFATVQTQSHQFVLLVQTWTRTVRVSHQPWWPSTTPPSQRSPHTNQ